MTTKKKRTPKAKAIVAAVEAKMAKPAEATERAACACGCGGTPVGKKATYISGHDQRHHAALKAAGLPVEFKMSAEARAKSAARTRARRAQQRELAITENAARKADVEAQLAEIVAPKPRRARKEAVA
jgi:hypothetical protein